MADHRQIFAVCRKDTNQWTSCLLARKWLIGSRGDRNRMQLDTHRCGERDCGCWLGNRVT